MKKYLLLLTSAALLLVGCAKEPVSNGVCSRDGELTKVTFTASLDNGVATKAVADGDGAAANVNRCIMEIYYGGELFAREYAPVNNQKKATFTAQVVSNRTYTVAFWADKVDATTEAGLQVDKYYTTNATGGLQAITINGSYLGNDDARDAFFYVGNDFTVAQTGTSWNDIKLKRPFAQMNVITTDWDKVTTVASLKPEKVNVTLKNALVNFNAVTGEASGSQTLTYEAAVYTAPDPVDPVSTTEKTLSMDYLFASAEKAVIDIDWKALHGTDDNVEHAFATVPYQRNYRTNIKGALLTTTGQWTVTVDPIWDSGNSGENDYNVYYTTVNEASEVKGAIEDKKGDSAKDGQPISVTINNEVGTGATNDDIIIPDDTPKEKTPEIILDFKKLTATAQIVIRDEEHPRDAAEATEGAKEYGGEVIVIVPEGTTAEQVKILTNKSTVTVRGEYGTVIASCAPHTIIIEKETVIGTLKVMKGNVEVYGKVTSIKNQTNPQEVVYVYLFPGSTWTNVETEKNDKLVPLYPVASIGANQYFSLQDAVDAAPANSEIKVLGDITGDGLKVASGKNFTLNFDGHTYTIDSTVGSQGTQTNGMQLLKGSTLKFVNGTIVSTKAKLLIQNYANLTLEDMNLDLSGATEPQLNYVISNNCGNVQILGNTSLKSRSGDGAAFDIYYWPQGGYTDGVNIVVNTTGTITGKIEMDHDNSVSDEAAIEKTSLKIQNGTFDAFIISAFDGANVEISGGKFSTEPKRNYIIIGKKTVKNGDYYELTDSDNWMDYVKSQPDDYVVDNSAKTVTLGSRDALIWFSKQTQSNQGIYPRYTITLTTDVDLSGKYWTPICAWNPDNPLTFDGDNHTVSNMMTRKEGENINYRSFFGHITANIKNFTMTGAKVLSSYAYTGVVSGDSYGNFENVHIVDCTVNGDYWCLGGITGFHNGGNMKNCSATRVSVTGGCPGGLVGTCNETDNRTYENCTASDCVLNDSVGFAAPYTYGAIIGVVGVKGVVMKNCSSSGMTYNSKSGVTYTSGDEGTQGAPAHALYGGAFEEVSVINE